MNLKQNNPFIMALGSEVVYYSALVRSLDSSLGSFLGSMAKALATLSYSVRKDSINGPLYAGQTEAIARLLEDYSEAGSSPHIEDYVSLISNAKKGKCENKKRKIDYYLYDEADGIHHLIELKMGGDLDNKKALSEKRALLERFAIVSNILGDSTTVKLHFATAYNCYGEGKEWKQERVLQFFAKEELLISRDFWNFICKSGQGYEIVLDEYKTNAHYIVSALNDIKRAYLPEE